MKNLLMIGTVTLLAMLAGVGWADVGQGTRSIQFDYDRAEIRPEVWPILHEVAGQMNADPTLQLLLVGHTDDLGTSTYNEELARWRVDSVLMHLTEVEGIARWRIADSIRGEWEPLFPNTNEFYRSLNRRVELTLLMPLAARATESDRAVMSVVAVAPERERVTGTPMIRDQAVMSAVAVAPKRLAVSLGVLLDQSGSINLPDLREAVHEFLAGINPADRFQIATFDQNLGKQGTVARHQAGMIVDAAGPSSEPGTSLYQTVAEVSAGSLAARPAPRYLIVFSDGIDELARSTWPAGRPTLDQAVAAANRNGVHVITVELGPASVAGRQALQALAARTGGRAVVWDRSAGPEQYGEVHWLLGAR